MKKRTQSIIVTADNESYNKKEFEEQNEYGI